MVDCGMVNGKRQRHFFQTKVEAETKALQLRTTRKNEGTAAFVIPETLRIEAMQCADLLQPFGISLLDAVRAYLPHLQAQRRTVAVETLAPEFLAAKRTDGASERYLQDLKNKLDTFVAAFGARMVASIGPEELDDWLRKLTSRSGRPVAALTRNNFRRVLVVVFNFAKLRRYCTENPVIDTAKAKEVEKPVGILSVPELTSLLKHAPKRILAYIAIGAFAGLRSSELLRLEWQDIDLKEKLIEIKAAKAKSARRRLVAIRPNLALWLKSHVRESGLVMRGRPRELLVSACEKAKIKHWPHNALRHSFASYCLAHENNAAALALEMGHTNTQMVFQHYREVVKPADAAKYWRIRPSRRRGISPSNSH